MDVTSELVTLHRISPVEAQRILARTPAEDDAWHAQYPFADELRPLAAHATNDSPEPVFTFYTVIENATGLAVGGIGFFGPPTDGRVEFGYGLVEAARGRGLATDAVLTLLGIATVGGATAAIADTEVGNTASQRVLAKTGFTEIRRDETLVYFELALR